MGCQYVYGLSHMHMGQPIRVWAEYLYGTEHRNRGYSHWTVDFLAGNSAYRGHCTGLAVIAIAIIMCFYRLEGCNGLSCTYV